MQKNILKRMITKDVYLGGMLLFYSLYRLNNKIIIPEICLDNRRKSFIKNVDEFKYNISHAGIWVVIAVSSYEIGVDIEEISNCREILSNLEFLFSEKETEYLRLRSDKSMMEGFVQFWTVKESYLKHKGVGLFKELDSFSVIDSDGDRFIKGVISKRVFGNYYLSIFSEQERETTEIRLDNANYKDFAERYKQYMMSKYDNKMCIVSGYRQISANEENINLGIGTNNKSIN